MFPYIDAEYAERLFDLKVRLYQSGQVEAIENEFKKYREGNRAERKETDSHEQHFKGLDSYLF